MKGLRGTFTPLVTTFRDGKIDQGALKALVERQLAAGVDGLVPCGTTGEASTLALSEHRPVVATVVKMAKRKALVVAGLEANTTAEAIDMVRLNEDCGASALLAVAPYYNQPSQEGLYRHYAAIAEATELPIVLYNIPRRCGVELSVETVRRLYETYSNVVAMKHATGSVAGAVDLMVACDIPILAGEDTLAYPLLSLGAVGVVSPVANLVPETVQRMVQAALDGEWVTAREVYLRLYPLVRALRSFEANPIPIKTALAIKGLCEEEFRLPLCPMCSENRRTLEALLGEHDAT